MNARAIGTFYGAKDGELYPTRFDPGDLLGGELATIAVREGWAEEIEPEPAEARSSPAMGGGPPASEPSAETKSAARRATAQSKARTTPKSTGDTPIENTPTGEALGDSAEK